MGIIKNVVNKVKDTYQKVDKRLGGRLPGGVVPTKKVMKNVNKDNSNSKSDGVYKSDSNALIYDKSSNNLKKGSSGKSNKNNSVNMSSNYTTQNVISPVTSNTLGNVDPNVNKIKNSANRQKVSDNFKKYYDKSVGKLFEGVEYLTITGPNKQKHKIQKDVINKGKEEYVQFGDENYTYGGTRILKDKRQYTNEELKNFKYAGDEELIKREVDKKTNEIRDINDMFNEQGKANVENDVKKYASDKEKEYLELVDSGKMTWEEANEKFVNSVKEYGDKRAEKENQEINNAMNNLVTSKEMELQDYSNKVTKEFGRKRAKSEIAQRFVAGALMGAGIVATGGVGAVIGGLQLGRTALDSKEIVAYVKNDPVKFGYETIPMLAGGMAGAKSVGYLKGEGNTKLASKISKIPDKLKMNGVIEYMNYMKTLPIEKLRTLQNAEGEFTFSTKGGTLTILRSQEGILKAVRKGKNWNEQIIMNTDGIIQGLIKRKFKGKDYFIKYRIDEYGGRLTEYFKGNKRFSVIEDEIKPIEYKSTEIKPTKLEGKRSYDMLEDGSVIGEGGEFKVYTDKDLASSKTIEESFSSEMKGKKIKSADEGKYNLKGEIKDYTESYKLNIADPVEFNKILMLAKKSGNKQDIAFIKEVEKRKAQLSKEKGTNEDLVQFGNQKIILDPNGNEVRLQFAKEIKSPNLEIIDRELKGTTFKVDQAKNPNIAIRTINKIEKVMVDDAIKGGRIYTIVDPATELITKIKMPELKIKTDVLKVNDNRLGKITALPRELTMEQLKYLIGIGAIDTRNLLDKLRDKSNLIIGERIYLTNAFRQQLSQLQQSRQSLSLNQQMALQQSLDNGQLSSDGKPFDPNFIIPTFKPNVLPFMTGTDSDKKMFGANGKYNKELFSQIRYNDPLEALTGKKKYSDKMNINLTKRYGNFYS